MEKEHETHTSVVLCTLVARWRWALLLEFKPQDCWVGVYWRSYYEMGSRMLSLWVCLLPMLPLHLTVMLTPWRCEHEQD